MSPKEGSSTHLSCCRAILEERRLGGNRNESVGEERIREPYARTLRARKRPPIERRASDGSHRKPGVGSLVRDSKDERENRRLGEGMSTASPRFSSMVGRASAAEAMLEDVRIAFEEGPIGVANGEVRPALRRPASGEMSAVGSRGEAAGFEAGALRGARQSPG